MIGAAARGVGAYFAYPFNMHVRMLFALILVLQHEQLAFVLAEAFILRLVLEWSVEVFCSSCCRLIHAN